MYEAAPVTPARSTSAAAGRVHDAWTTKDPTDRRMAANPKRGCCSRQFDHAIYVARQIPHTAREGRRESARTGGELQTSPVQGKILFGIRERRRPAEH